MVVIACYGLLRLSEMESLTFEQVKFEGSICFVTIYRKKQIGALRPTNFAITDSVCTNILQRYFEFFPINDRKGRFLRYIVNGKGSNRPVGKNKVSEYPGFVASFLGLSPSGYSGHCWRRTAATILAEADVSVIQLKLAGGWKSDQVCQRYIEETKSEKLQIASRLSFFQDECTTTTSKRKIDEVSESPPINISMSNCTGCTLNYFTPNHQFSYERK